MPSKSRTSKNLHRANESCGRDRASINPKKEIDLNKIIHAHQKGDFDIAELGYKNILSKTNNPRKLADVHQLLGALYAQTGQYDEALNNLNKSLELNPNQSVVYNNLGNVHLDLGQFSKAINCYDLAINLKKDYPQAWHNKGNAFFALHDFSQSIECYLEAIKLNPNDCQNFNHLGNAQQKLYLYQDALTSYKKALSIDSSNSEILNNIAILHKNLVQHELALQYFDQAIGFNFNNPELHYNRGCVLKELNRINDSINAFCTAINLKSDYFEAYNNLASILKDEKEWEKSLTLYSKVIDIKNDYAPAYFNRGLILQELNELNEATLNYEAALSIDPDYADAHLNLGLVSLMQNNYELGWMHYGWRFKSENQKNGYLNNNYPYWSSLSDYGRTKKLLIWSEQGVGDELMFCSLLNEFLVCLNNTEVIVQVDGRLIPLLKYSIKEVSFVPKNLSFEINDFDEQMPIADLAKHMRPNINSFLHQKETYLFIDDSRITALREELKIQSCLFSNINTAKTPKKIIGISWFSNAPKTGQQRSIPLREIVKIFDPSEYRLISLQYGEVRTENELCLKEIGHQVEVLPGLDYFNDFQGLASLMMLCDEIISVDNVTVHLAASLGRKVNVLLPFHPDWRWSLSTSKSHWYPCIKLFRQLIPGDWQSVLSEIKNIYALKDADN
jgi:tetratricopeptide (TPR) repeat protein